jgi:hypothetical protein
MIATIHVVTPGETLWSISQEAYGNGNDWSMIWDDNRATVADPNLIYPGEQIYVPKHAAPTAEVVTVANSNQPDSDNGPVVTSTGLSGTLGCNGLESLWVDNGGNPSAAFTAAEIAMAESSGEEFATGPYGERGYWQINPVNGSLSTYDPDGNARAAIELSSNGTDWDAWTTYLTGAYEGQC